jgi:hypothetical protein
MTSIKNKCEFPVNLISLRKVIDEAIVDERNSKIKNIPFDHVTKLIQNGINNFEKESVSLQIKHAILNNGVRRASTKLLRVNA